MHISSILKNEPNLAKRAAILKANPELEFPVLSAKIKLTWDCNLRCAMCNLWRQKQRGAGLLSLDCLKDTLSTLAKKGLRKVHFSGGEVLLSPLLFEITSFAKTLDLQVNLTTNGTLIDKEYARFFVDARVHTINISIDSPLKKEHDLIRGKNGAWEASWKGVSLIQKRKEKKGRGPKIGVNTLVTRRNIDSLDKMYDLIISRKVQSWRLLPIDTEIKKLRPTKKQWANLCGKLSHWKNILTRAPLDWSSKRSGSRAESGKYAGVFYGDKMCFAPWFNVFIDADGKVYPCCMGKQDMKPYGNILNTTIDKLRKGASRRNTCYSLASGHIFPACEKCDDFLEENLSLNSL